MTSRAPAACGTRLQPRLLRSAPIPVKARTCILANRAGSAGCRSVTEPSQPRKKASGIATIPGLSSGKNAKLICGSVISDGMAPGAAPETTGEKMPIITRDRLRPPAREGLITAMNLGSFGPNLYPERARCVPRYRPRAGPGCAQRQGAADVRVRWLSGRGRPPVRPGG